MISSDVQKAFQTMNLASIATEREINSKYRQLAYQNHPDRNQYANAKENFQNLQSAYECLQKYFRGLGAAKSASLDDHSVNAIIDGIRNQFRRNIATTNPVNPIRETSIPLRQEQIVLRNKKFCTLTERFSLEQTIQERVRDIQESSARLKVSIQEQSQPITSQLSENERCYGEACQKIAEFRNAQEANFQRELQKIRSILQYCNAYLEQSGSSDSFGLNPQAYMDFKNKHEARLNVLDQELSRISAIYEQRKKDLEEQLRPFKIALKELNARTEYVAKTLFNLGSEIENTLEYEIAQEQDELYSLITRESCNEPICQERKNILLSRHILWMSEYKLYSEYENLLSAEAKEIMDKYTWIHELQRSEDEKSKHIFVSIIGIFLAAISAFFLRKTNPQKSSSKANVEELKPLQIIQIPEKPNLESIEMPPKSSSAIDHEIKQNLESIEMPPKSSSAIDHETIKNVTMIVGITLIGVAQYFNRKNRLLSAIGGLCMIILSIRKKTN